MAQQAAATAQQVAVTPDSFNRAESDMYFGVTVQQGGFGKFHHHREIMPIDKQTVIRSNRDTVYSSGVFDLDAGPVTITLPDPGARFMSVMIVDEDHYVSDVRYAPATVTLTRAQIGTRYVLAAIRTFVDPGDSKDVEQVHVLQDAIKASQSSLGRFEVPSWDPISQKQVREALLALSRTVPDSTRMFGSRNEVDPVRHLIGTAFGWGGNPEKDAKYINVVPAKNDGKTIHRLAVKDVPVDGFWSVSVYNKDGYFEKNAVGMYTLNNVTAKKSADGSVAIQFGGCDGSLRNCIPISPGWNYIVRLYRPRAEILNGTWTFPEAQPLG